MDVGAGARLQERRSFSTCDDLDERPVGQAVFLHGMWRSGSTYLWSRFRAAADTRCFYEPLHHGLAKLTPARIERDTPERIDANRHPALSQPYFAEFAPVIARRGVRGFHRSLAYDHFILEPGQAHAPLERYLNGLIGHSVAEDRTPVLGFNRSGLRVAWMKRRFDGYHIHMDREPAALWASYMAEKAQGNYAFFSMWLSVVEKNAHHPLIAPVVERLNLRPSRWPITNAKARHRQIVDSLSPEESYTLIYYLWLACTGHALAACDLLIDTQLAQTARYQRHVADKIVHATGLQVDLSAMRAAPARLTLAPEMQMRVERSVSALFPRTTLPKTRAATHRLSQISPRNADRLALAF